MAASNVTSDVVLFNQPESHSKIQSCFIKIEDTDHLEINLNVKCRGCFAEDSEMHYLFAPFDRRLTLAEILGQTTLYEITEDDGFPPYLCVKCTTSVVEFFNFKIQFESTDLYIRTLLYKNDPVSLENTHIKKEVPVEFDREETNEENKDSLYVQGLYEIQASSCETCSMEFRHSGEYDTHMAKAHGKNPFQKYTIFRHLVSEKEKAKQESQRKLKYIKADIEEIEMLQMPGKLCRFCRKKFPDEEFQTHWDLHKKHICEHCGHKCIKKSDLDIHKQSVHGHERNFACQICGKSFKTKQLLNRHTIVHTNPRSFICHKCGQRFNDRSTLNTHIKLKHIRNRNFICSICGRAFPLKSTLEKHILRHNKNRPPNFFCNICNAGFKDNSSLKRHHLTKHTEDYEKPQCQFCKKNYCSSTKLRYHIERHHSGVKYQRKRRLFNRSEIQEKYSISGSENEDSNESYSDINTFRFCPDSRESCGDVVKLEGVNVLSDSDY